MDIIAGKLASCGLTSEQISFVVNGGDGMMRS